MHRSNDHQIASGMMSTEQSAVLRRISPSATRQDATHRVLFIGRPAHQVSPSRRKLVISALANKARRSKQCHTINCELSLAAKNRIPAGPLNVDLLPRSGLEVAHTHRCSTASPLSASDQDYGTFLRRSS